MYIQMYMSQIMGPRNYAGHLRGNKAVRTKVSRHCCSGARWLDLRCSIVVRSTNAAT